MGSSLVQLPLALYSAAMLNPSDLDSKAIAARFDRLASGTAGNLSRSIDHADFLLREIERRMLERLSWTKLEPSTILDVGCGAGAGIVALQQRYPEAFVAGIDLSLRMSQRASTRIKASKVDNTKSQRFFSRLGAQIRHKLSADSPNLIINGASECLPIKDSSIDLLWSNLLFHWLPNAAPAVEEWYRVIRPGGLVSFTAFGVDTFKELKSLGLPLMALPDMHDIGDLLASSGFAEPVMDQQKIVLTYAEASKIIQEVASLGGDVRRARTKGLATRKAYQTAMKAVETLRGGDGKIALTVEVIFGHTWCPAQKKLQDGWAPLQMKPYVRNSQVGS